MRMGQSNRQDQPYKSQDLTNKGRTSNKRANTRIVINQQTPRSLINAQRYNQNTRGTDEQEAFRALQIQANDSSIQ